MTKKDKILKLFNEAEWMPSLSGNEIKILTYDDFFKAGLSPTIEFGEKYCDVIYAAQIFRKSGYKINIGSAFYINKPPPKPQQ